MNFYEILDVAQSASAEEIKSSFRKLAKKYHPDVNDAPEAKDHFRLVYMAYDILQDERKRRLYDELQVLKEQGYTPGSRPRTGRERDEMRRYQNMASRQANTYANMQYQQFEDTFLSKLGFHSSQLLAFFMFFVVLCIGFVGISVGSYYVFYADFNGSKVFGYALWLFGGAFCYVGLKALWDIFETWRN